MRCNIYVIEPGTRIVHMCRWNTDKSTWNHVLNLFPCFFREARIINLNVSLFRWFYTCREHKPPSLHSPTNHWLASPCMDVLAPPSPCWGTWTWTVTKVTRYPAFQCQKPSNYRFFHARSSLCVQMLPLGLHGQVTVGGARCLFTWATATACQRRLHRWSTAHWVAAGQPLDFLSGQLWTSMGTDTQVCSGGPPH